MTGKRRRKELVESSESEEEEDSFDSDSESDQSASDPGRVFCKCGEPNTENMIGCDGLGCLYEWLHFDCGGVNPKNIPKGKWLCPDCHSKQKEEIPEIPSGQFVWPAANSDKENKSAKVADPIMESSLNQAEVQHARNLRKACDEVIYRGKSVSNAAQQFHVGRYVLSDYVNDQLKRNLTRACESVLNKKYTVQRAAVVFGVIPAILEERVQAVESKQCTADGRRVDPSLTSSSFEDNLQQACKAVVAEELTIEEASQTFMVSLEELQNKLQSVQSVLTTKEENDLVKLCIRLTVLGQSSCIKATVMSKIKELLDKEESRGIKRLHSFSGNKPNDFWWDTFRRRHPEFKAIDSVESTDSKGGALIQNSSVTISQSNSVATDVQNQFWTQPVDLSSGPSKSRPITPAPQINLVPSGVALTPLPPQPIIQNPIWNNNQCETKPNPPTADNLVYILNPSPVTTQQFVLVKQSPLPDKEVTEAGPTEVAMSTPTVLNQPDCEVGGSQSVTAQPQNSHRVENSLPTGDNDCSQQSLESETSEVKDPVVVLAADTDKLTQKYTEVADILNTAQDNPDISKPPSSEIELPSAVGDTGEVILASIDVGSNEVVQTDGAISDETSQPALTVGDHELPPTSVVLTEAASKNELSVPSEAIGSNGADHIDQVVAEEVVETSLVSPNNVASSDTDAASSQASPPQISIVSAQPCVAAGVSGEPQTSQQTELNGTTTAAVIPQPFPVAPSIPTPQPNLKIVPNRFAQPNYCVVTNQVVQPQSSFIVQPTPIIVANQVAQPSPILLNNNVIQPNLVANTNQVLTQNYVVVQNSAVQPNVVQSLPTAAVKPSPVGSPPSDSSNGIPKPPVGSMSLPDSTKVGIPNKELQSYLDETGGKEGIPLVIPMSGTPRIEKPLPQPQAKVFVSKHRVDKMQDALTCLEKTLTEEQKEAFAFRLQIGDDRQDDAVYNAWKALRRLYHHKNIYSLYDMKAPNVDKMPFCYDVPAATKLLRTPLMDPVNYDEHIPKKDNKQGQEGTRPGSNILAELRRGRKRKHITAVLERRGVERKKGRDARRFLEPWRHKMVLPGKRKRFIAKYMEDNVSEEDEDKDNDRNNDGDNDKNNDGDKEDWSDSESESEDLEMDDDSLDNTIGQLENIHSQLLELNQ